MREPRPGQVWSRDRVLRRAAYATWMGSDEWLAFRQAWLADWEARHGCDPACLICGRGWTLEDGHLHHRSYQRLGHERLTDLVPLCRTCHVQVHAVLEATPAWRRLWRPHATDLAIGCLRRARLGRNGGDR